MRHLLLSLFVIAANLIALPLHAQQTRQIEHIGGDLYRFQNNFHYSVFLVTPEGVIATDPINADAANWLKQEINTRFGKPIKYVVYSHDHVDHIAGGEVLAEGAVVVAHENAKEAIVGEGRPTAVPEITFSDRLTLELGGKQVELFYVGQSHSNNMIVMHFPDERALFAVDFISVKRVAYKTLTDSYFPQWIDAIKKVEAMDFDILIPGHGSVGTKADAIEHRQYLEALYSAVLSAARKGESLETMQAGIRLDTFQHFDQYEDWLPLNIEGMYNQVQLHRRGN